MLRVFYNPLFSSNYGKLYRNSIFREKIEEKSIFLLKFLYHCLNMMPFKIHFELNFKHCT